MPIQDPDFREQHATTESRLHSNTTRFGIQIAACREQECNTSWFGIQTATCREQQYWFGIQTNMHAENWNATAAGFGSRLQHAGNRTYVGGMQIATVDLDTRILYLVVYTTEFLRTGVGQLMPTCYLP